METHFGKSGGYSTFLSLNNNRSHSNVMIQSSSSLMSTNENSDSSDYIKLGLFGPGNSGKSTFLKQLEFCLRSGERVKSIVPVSDMKGHIYSALKNLVNDVEFKLPLVSPDATDISEETRARIRSRQVSRRSSITSATKPTPKLLDPDVKSKIQKILDNPDHLQMILDNTLKHDIHESFSYWFPDRIVEAIKDSYTPTEDDYLHAYLQTLYQSKKDVKNDKICLRVLDVPGERIYRSGWVSMYDQVDYIIFCTSLTSYTQKLSKDSNVTLMHDSFSLFDAVVNHKANETKPVILVLSKQDRFAETLKSNPFNEIFPEMGGECTVSNTLFFIISNFKDRLDSTNRPGKFQIHIMDCLNISKFRLILKNIETLWDKEMVRRQQRRHSSAVPFNGVDTGPGTNQNILDGVISLSIQNNSGSGGENPVGLGSMIVNDGILLSTSPAVNPNPAKIMKRGASLLG